MASKIALLCCLSGVFCALLPLLLGSNDTAHYCANCNRKVAHKPYGGPAQVLRPNLDAVL